MSRLKLAVLASLAASAVMATSCAGDQSTAKREGDGERITLTVHRPTEESPPDNDILKREIDKALGIDLRLVTTGGTEYETQLSASLAAGDPPDLFSISRPMLRKLASQGLLLDLTEYMDNELTTYTQFVSPETRTRGKIDGRDYALASKSGYFYPAYWIRKDWLDNLGLEVPRTVDELFEVARAFTKDDPDGNGKNDTYGLTGDRGFSAFMPLWGAFGSGGPGNFYLKDGEIVNGYVDPATKDALAFIQKLNKQGVVDPDWVTNEFMTAHERAWQGRAGILYFSWSEMTKPEFVDQYKKANPEAEWIQMAPPSGPAGEGALPRDRGAVTLWAIPRALEKDEAKLQKVFDLINFVSSQEGNRLVMYGLEGRHYTLDGQRVVPTDKLAEEGNYFWLYQLTGRDDEDYLATKFAAQQEYIDFANNQPFIEIYNSLVTPPEDYNAGDASRFIEEQFARFVSGARPLSEYDEFLDTLLNKFGYADYIESAKEQIRAAGIQQ
ncbi:MAG TPA: extracellular solute-binding protein [Actinopolymorphaceae bacterium]